MMMYWFLSSELPGSCKRKEGLMKRTAFLKQETNQYWESLFISGQMWPHVINLKWLLFYLYVLPLFCSLIFFGTTYTVINNSFVVSILEEPEHV